MATINMSGGSGVKRYEKFPGSPEILLHNTVDFSKFNAGSGDTVQFLRVPALVLVQFVIHRVLTAEGGTSTGTIGDGTDPDGWILLVDNNATAGTALMSNGKFSLAEGAPNTITYSHAYGAAGGKLYSAEDTIDMVLSANAVDAAKIQIIAGGLDLNAL